MTDSNQTLMCPPLKDRGVELVHVLGLLKKAAHNRKECFEHAFHDVHDMLICNIMMMMMMMMHDDGHSSEGHFMQTAYKLLHAGHCCFEFQQRVQLHLEIKDN